MEQPSPIGGNCTSKPQHAGTGSHAAAPKRSKGKVLAAVLGVVLVAILAAYGISGAVMYVNLSAIRSEAPLLAEHLAHGTSEDIGASGRKIASAIRSLDNQIHGPQWTLAGMFAGISTDLENARELAAVANTLGTGLLEAITEEIATQDAGSLLQGGKQLNAQSLEIAVATLAQARDTVHEANGRVCALQAGSMGQLETARTKLESYLDVLDQLAQVCPQLAGRISYLLGADGSPRHYLLVALNAAELRSVGGLPGSYGTLSFNNGKLGVSDFLSLSDTQRLVPTKEEATDTTTIAPGLTDEEQVLFGRRVVNVPAETATNPQFSRFAESFSYLYTYRGHGDVDGVVAMDIAFFEELIKVIGGITTSAGIEVDGTNASALLLHESYAYMKNAEQDAFFSEVANTAFDEFFDNMDASKLQGLLKAVWASRNSRHLQAWIPDEEIESAIRALGYAGDIAGTEEEPVLGVFINDDTWSKVSWFLDINTQIGEASANADGSYSYPVSVEITNHLSLEEAEELRAYVVGYNWRKRSKADMLDWVFFYAPLGGSISNLQADAYFTPLGRTRSGFNGILEHEGMNQAAHLGREVWFSQIQVDGQETATFTFTVTTSPRAQAGLQLQQTPTARYW